MAIARLVVSQRPCMSRELSACCPTSGFAVYKRMLRTVKDRQKHLCRCAVDLQAHLWRLQRHVADVWIPGAVINTRRPCQLTTVWSADLHLQVLARPTPSCSHAPCNPHGRPVPERCFRQALHAWKRCLHGLNLTMGPLEGLLAAVPQGTLAAVQHIPQRN